MDRFSSTGIEYLKGVGPARAKVLAEEFEIRTFRDLLYYFPFRYTDRSRFYMISELRPEMPMVQVKGRIIGFATEGEGVHKRLIGTFSDGKSLMQLVWFRRIKQIRDSLQVGSIYVAFGRPNLFKGSFSIVHPEMDLLSTRHDQQGFRGQYNLTDKARKRGFTSRAIAKLVETALQHPGFGEISETLPESVVSELHLMSLREALLNIHFPDSPDSLRKARERMKIEELFYVQLHILRYARERKLSLRGPVFARVGDLFNSYYKDFLPFELTRAQKRVIKEMRADMLHGRQMNRLVQGDVGCGKTMVAFMMMLLAADNGFQSALMAPTEILARQHAITLSEWGDAIGVKVELLTGSTKQSERRRIAASLESGETKILVGTHALIEDTVRFRNLGLAVIDEQHRFGVAQRARLWQKAALPPHVLVMTATPIPRTLAMTVYGDLDISVIDELPPGRKPVTTLLRLNNERADVNRLVAGELRAGRQVYIVYPLVHEKENQSLKSVEEGFRNTVAANPDYRVCLVHGQLSPDEKERQMNLFVEGKAQIMVATTVIEVGVNVPNASVMIIENAERFGLAQLHQLRGRVGRGSDKSYCILITDSKTQGMTRERLELMTRTTDGFVVAEADMKMRGPGDMEGTQQSGMAFNLRIANLATDGQLLSIARHSAGKFLDSAPELSRDRSISAMEQPPQGTASRSDIECAARELHLRFDNNYDWSRIS